MAGALLGGGSSLLVFAIAKRRVARKSSRQASTQLRHLDAPSRHHELELIAAALGIQPE
jgi:hypothetical protein